MKIVQQIEADGFAIMRSVYSAELCRQIAAELEAALAACKDEATALKRQNGAIYGARNLLRVFPAAAVIWRREPLVELLSEVLGSDFGLVRGLYFDKPPRGNWSLPWHQDLTIAVKDHSLPSERFRRPTIKAGVPHVEAPDELLKQMLTLRIHLDDATEENGPLQVLPGTHVGRGTEVPFRPPVTIFAAAGDVLAIRPLLSHSSAASREGTDRHRRVIHLEFAASRKLPDSFEWQDFLPYRGD
jgi:ectoine hydroxylase-related dioxygenase (phytanoyl-CoA dioxygenase family)